VSRVLVAAYDREQHESAFTLFSEKVLGAETTRRRQRVINTFHERMPARDRAPIRCVCLDGDTVAGTLGYMPADFLVNGERQSVRYTHDLLVDPAYTGYMLGKRIILDTLKRGDFFPGGMWMTETCYKLHLFCGFEDAPRLTTFTSVLDQRAFLARRRFPPLRRAAVRVALEAVRARAMLNALRILSRSRVTLDAAPRFDTAHDAAWMDMARSYTMTRVRDAAYLNWKYTDHPTLDYRIVRATNNGSPRGFMIWRPAPDGVEERRAVIADFLVERNDRQTLQAMAARVLLDAASSSVDSVAVLTTQSWAQAALRPLGFLPGRTHNTWVVGGWRDAMPHQWLKDPDQWHMCLGDSDGDIWEGAA
jgi:hypothetical protein